MQENLPWQKRITLMGIPMIITLTVQAFQQNWDYLDYLADCDINDGRSGIYDFRIVILHPKQGPRSDRYDWEMITGALCGTTRNTIYFGSEI
jgi:hypothetical protein